MILIDKVFLRHMTNRMFIERAARSFPNCSIHPIGSEYSLKSCSSAELFSASSDDTMLNIKNMIEKKTYQHVKQNVQLTGNQYYEAT